MLALVAGGFLSQDWRDVIEVIALIGVAATLIALIIAFFQIRRTTKSAEAARKAADSTRTDVAEDVTGRPVEGQRPETPEREERTARVLEGLSGATPGGWDSGLREPLLPASTRWYELEQELTTTRNRLEEAQHRVALADEKRELDIAHSAATELGMFILDKVANSEGGLILADVAANLEGPRGWIAIGRLMRAGLLDENGRSLYLTPEGESVVLAFHVNARLSAS